VSAGAQGFRDPGFVCGDRQGRNKFGGSATIVVDLLCDDGALPIRALAPPEHLVATKSSVVGFGADDQNAIGGIEFIEHPARPALGRRAVHILIKDGSDTVIAQPLGEGEYPFPMFDGIMAVANEDVDLAHRWQYLQLGSQSWRLCIEDVPNENACQAMDHLKPVLKVVLEIRLQGRPKSQEAGFVARWCKELDYAASALESGRELSSADLAEFGLDAPGSAT